VASLFGINPFWDRFLEGGFERSVSPIDVPEMKTTASFILRKIEEKDPDQYSALLQSIGVEDA